MSFLNLVATLLVLAWYGHFIAILIEASRRQKSRGLWRDLLWFGVWLFVGMSIAAFVDWRICT